MLTDNETQAALVGKSGRGANKHQLYPFVLGKGVIDHQVLLANSLPRISDTYLGLQMSAILMNTPKIRCLGIRFLRIALKIQHSLAGVVLHNRQEVDILIPEHRGT